MLRTVNFLSVVVMIILVGFGHDLVITDVLVATLITQHCRHSEIN
jgi:hypothetical protein